ncbi:MAG: DUF882 domain-containing protein [Desulfosarcina sp.]|jgi:uncharacterized protein YcbK (DUF882 family)
MGSCNRREFIQIGCGFLTSCLIPATGWTALQPDHGSRSLGFYNTHTAERLRVCFCENGAYRPDGIKRINHILRDHRTGEVQAMDVRLLDLLYRVNQRLAPGVPFHIISGYRSPRTNNQLRKHSRGVAKFSFHMLGRAIDVRLPGCATQKLRQACLDLEMGGVGYYPRSDFVHLDTGAFRTWQG